MNESILIVGGGVSRKETSFIGEFKGKIMATDVATHELLDKDIMPDYVTWLETDDVNVEFLVISIIPRLRGTLVVHRQRQCPRVIKEATKHNIHLRGFSPPTYVNNVGLFSLVFAQQVLHCKDIHLIGMEHWGDPYSDNWYNDMLNAFSRYMTNEQDESSKITDHSNNGRLELHEKDWYNQAH